MPEVLVLDDEKDLLEMVCLALNLNKITAICFSNKDKFFERLSLKIPDMILMDIYLGEHDGREICKELKGLSRYSQIPIILYSAGNISSDSIDKSGADDFIAKPFDIKILTARLLSHIKN